MEILEHLSEHSSIRSWCGHIRFWSKNDTKNKLHSRQLESSSIGGPAKAHRKADQPVLVSASGSRSPATTRKSSMKRIFHNVRFVILCAVLSNGCSCTLSAQTPQAKPQYAQLTRDLSLYISQKLTESKVTGASVAIVDGRKTVWAEGFGYTNAAHLKKVTADTVFSLQSISKTYTAVLLLGAVDRGWFKLDDPLVKYLPNFRVNSRYSETEFQKITLRHLLSHWSGLPHEAPVGNNYDDGNATFEEHIQSINRVWLLAPVQGRYAYSNLGFDLLAYLLQTRSKTPFPAYADAHLFHRLAMSNTTFDKQRALASPSFARGQVSGHDVNILIPMLGAGGLYSTAADMAKFVAVELADTKTKSGRLLKKETLEEMFTPQFPVDHQSAGYGLGIFKRFAFGTVMYSHGGGGYGYDTEQRWFPKFGLGVVVLTNDGDGSDIAQIIADHISEVCIKAKGGLTSDDVPSILVPGQSKKPGRSTSLSSRVLIAHTVACDFSR